jgi:hypothetical protein
MTRARRAPDGDDDGQRSAVLVTTSLPCEEFVLSETLSRVPDASFRGETTIESGASVLPLLWARSRRQDELDAALREDPTTESVTRLTDRGDTRLYRVSWANGVQFPVDLLTADGATILDVGVNAEAWTVRMLFPSRSALGSTVDRCEEYGLSVELRKLGRVGGDGPGQYDLTATQYDSLRLAAERGYYQIPRQSKLDDLADEADVSHQAYSERLRRATGSLVEQTLLDTSESTDEGF